MTPNNLEITKKVSQTNYYSNANDLQRTYDVSAKVTTGENAPLAVEEGVVRLKDSDASVATFTKNQWGSLSVTFVTDAVQTTETAKQIVEAVFSFISEFPETTTQNNKI